MIVSKRLTNCASDANELVPATESIPAETGDVSAVLTDAGCVNIDAFEELADAGLDLYVTLSKDENLSNRRHDIRPR